MILSLQRKPTPRLGEGEHGALRNDVCRSSFRPKLWRTSPTDTATLPSFTVLPQFQTKYLSLSFPLFHYFLFSSVLSITFHSITLYQRAALFILPHSLSFTLQQQQWRPYFPAASHHHRTPLWINSTINQLLKTSVGFLPATHTHTRA